MRRCKTIKPVCRQAGNSVTQPLKQTITMKIILTLLLPFAALWASAQTDTTEVQIDSVEVQIIALPDSTAIGAPDGKSVSKEIGPAGGKIVSDDGRLELNFPDGALTAMTVISIQPIANLIPNGSDRAYQFEPSGLRFMKPAELIFHYTKANEEVCPPYLKFMATQSHNGKLEYLHYEDWDSTTKTLKGSISHFSAFLDGNMMELTTVDTTIKVGKRFSLHLAIVAPPGDPGEDEIPLLPPPTNTSRQISWSVQGGQRFGTIRRAINKYDATYTAPNQLPGTDAKVVLKINEVTLRTVIQRSRGGARGWRGTTLRVPTTTNLATFTCRVKLYDEYKVTVGHDMKVEGARMTDTSTFRLRIGTGESASMSDINNQLAKLHIRQSKCKAIHVNASTCVGMINVKGISASNVTPLPGGSLKVNIAFQPATMVFPVVNFPPCGHNRASPTTPPIVTPYAFPMRLSFEAKNERQYLSLANGDGAPVRQPGPEDIIATIEPIRD